MDLQYKNLCKKRIKLIYNPVSGVNKESPAQLTNVITELQMWNFDPELLVTEKDTDYAAVVRDAVENGIRLFAVCGGDGTVSSVARAIYGTKATLGIILTGTQNNVAMSLGLPNGIKEAIAILRTGRLIKSDIGLVTCGNTTVPFIEICSVGLFSALFESGDDIQHGDISRIGDFLATLTTSTPSKIRLILDKKEEIEAPGHVVLVSNMPYIGRRYQVGSKDSYRDGLLDVIFCADIPKLDLMVGYILKLPGLNVSEDSRIKRFQVKNVVIEARPEMPVMADGIALEKDKVKIEIHRGALSVMAGPIRRKGKKGEKSL
jgi:diacylglycerol kinase (ATP)